MSFKTRWPLLNSGRSLGVEITDSHIKAVEVSVHSEGFKIHSFGEEKLSQGLIQEGRIQDFPKVVVLLQQLLARMNVKTKNVHSVLPSSAMMVRYLKFPDLPTKELRKVVDFEIKHNIHLPFDKPVYDFIKQTDRTDEVPAKRRARKKLKIRRMPEPALAEAAASIDPFAEFNDNTENLGHEIPECDVLLVASSQEVVDEYRTVLETAGLKPLSLEIKAFSLYRLLETLSWPGIDETLLLIDLNETATDLSIFDKGQLKITRSVPVLFTESEENKNQQENTASFLTFSEFDNDASFDAAQNELGHELERFMNFYRYSLNHRNHVFDRLVMAGDIDRMSEVTAYLEERLNVSAQRIESDRLTADPAFHEALSRLAVPAGLALRRGDH